jgi:hypothetical protein
MRTRFARSSLVACVLAGAVFALGPNESFAGTWNNTLLPSWAVFPAQLAWPDDPRFPSRGLWPDDPRYMAGPTSIYTPQTFVSSFDQERLSSFKSSTSSEAGVLNFGMDSEFRDSTKTDGQSFLGFFVGNSSKWQDNQVGYTNLKMNMGESIRFSTRFGASSYEASQDFFNSLAEKKSPEDTRAARFAGIGSASGTAAHSRMEEDVMRFGDAKVTLFQEFARVDPYFEDIKFSDKSQRQQTRDDVFSKPDRDTLKYGVSFSQGSSGVSFSQSSISNITEGPNSFYREQRYDSKVWVGVRDAYSNILSSDSLLGTLAPTNIWVGYGEGNVRRNGPDLPGATVTDMNAGVFWRWNNIYMSVGVWRSLLSGPQQVSAMPMDAFSDGADLSLGVSSKRWKVNGYVSFVRSNYVDGSTNSNNNSINGGISLSLLFEKLPNVTLAFDVSNYVDAYNYIPANYNYLTYNGTDGGRFSTAGIAFDLSKYLVQESKQKLEFFYYARKEDFDSRWGAVTSQNLAINHVFGAITRTRW